MAPVPPVAGSLYAERRSAGPYPAGVPSAAATPARRTEKHFITCCCVGVAQESAVVGAACAGTGPISAADTATAVPIRANPTRMRSSKAREPHYRPAPPKPEG